MVTTKKLADFFFTRNQNLIVKQSYLAVPVQTGLHYIGVINATKLNIPDAKIKAGPPGKKWNFRRKSKKREKINIVQIKFQRSKITNV